MPILNLERVSRHYKTLWYYFPRFTFQYSIEKKSFLLKTKLQAKKMGHLNEKRLKTVIYMRHSIKNYFSKSKSHSLNAAHDQKTSLAQKKFVHTAIFLTFAFRSNKASERIVLPVKKNLKKTNTPLRVVKKPRAPQYSFAQLTASQQ